MGILAFLFQFMHLHTSKYWQRKHCCGCSLSLQWLSYLLQLLRIMFQCQINKLSGGIILSIIVVLLSSLCSYGITEYCNHLQIALLQLNDIPFSYRMLFKMSSGIAALVPLMIFMFLYFTSDMMLNTVFEEKVDRRSLLSIIGISYIPMLIYQYIFWYNLITYCAIGKLADAKDLLSVPFM